MSNEKYLVTELDGNVIASSNTIGPWETFRVEQKGDLKIALKSYISNKILAVDQDGDIYADKDTGEVESIFTAESVSDKYSTMKLKSFNGNYLNAGITGKMWSSKCVSEKGKWIRML